MKHDRVKDLVLRSLQHERSCATVYRTAIRCAAAPELVEEWSRYLEETEAHVGALAKVCTALNLAPEEHGHERDGVNGLGAALVEAMTNALLRESKDAAQLLACECVVLAETKDHLHWELLGKVAKELPGAGGAALREAHARFSEQQDEHLYRTQSRCRELWMGALDLAAVVPPPEERKHAPSLSAAQSGSRKREQASSS